MADSEAFGYLRVSGKSQVETDGFTRQQLAVEKYAAANGLKVVKIFREEAVAGKTEWDRRPAWTEMIRNMNGARTIIIERLDRVARDLMVQEHIIADLKKRGISLISTEEPDLDSDSPTRVLMRQIMGAIAQYDKSMIVEKLKVARERIRESAGRCEGRKPYGELAGEDVVLAEMRNEVEAGETPAGIARLLNQRGRRTRSGGDWHPFVVSRILQRSK